MTLDEATEKATAFCDACVAANQLALRASLKRRRFTHDEIEQAVTAAGDFYAENRDAMIAEIRAKIEDAARSLAAGGGTPIDRAPLH